MMVDRLEHQEINMDLDITTYLSVTNNLNENEGEKASAFALLVYGRL